MEDRFTKEKFIALINRDFASLKKSLIQFTKADHSGSYTDFNEASPGMALLEWSAFVGDNMSFYIDDSFKELDMRRARQLENVVSLAKSKGYRPRGKSAATGPVHVAIEVPARTDGSGNVIPDESYIPVLRAGSQFEGAGATFESVQDLNFSSSLDRQVTGSRFDPTTGTPTHFGIFAPVDAVGGETKTESFQISEFKRFRRLELTNADVLEILSVTDSDGNEWDEVEYLAQDWVIDAVQNDGEDSSAVPYLMRLRAVPRRFIVDRDVRSRKSSLVFGSGDGLSFDDELIPSVADYSIPVTGRRRLSMRPIDPRNFLKTSGLGLSPYSTTVTVRYRCGGGPETNVEARVVRNVSRADLTFPRTDLSPTVRGSVESSVSCVNLERMVGGLPEETIEEIKANSDAFFAAQGRAVTREDTVAHVLSMPEKFGRPEKVYVRPSLSSAAAMDIHVLSRDANGLLTTATPGLKKNIQTYMSRVRMLTDGMNILDSDIINLKLNFGVVIQSKSNRDQVLLRCFDDMMEFFDKNRGQINQPIVLSEISSRLQDISSVISVYQLEFRAVAGTIDGYEYSTVSFDPTAATRNGIIYCPENAIFEVRYPRKDIVGSTR